jgi:putative DNA primase/helicase
MMQEKENPATWGGQPGKGQNTDKICHSGAGLSNDISIYSGAKQPTPTSRTTWQNSIDAIMSDRFRPLIEKIRAEADEDERRELKKRLPAVTFAGLFSKRNKEEIVTPTGFITADLDHLGDQLPEIRAMLERDPLVWFIFISPSGDGLKAGIRTRGIKTDDDHKKLYAAVELYFLEVYGIKIDPSCKDICRLTFLSHDPAAHINEDANYFDVVAWTTESEVEPFEQPEPPPQENRDNGWKARYGAKVLESSCRKIRESLPTQQHHTRLNMGRLIGGYIASGFIEEAEALTALENAVRESGAKRMRAAMLTVRDGIEYGKRDPIDVVSNQSHSRINEATTKKAESVSIAEVTQAAFDRQSGAAALFVKVFQGHFVFDHAAGIWYVWAGHHWKPEPYGEPLSGCDVIQRLFRDARNHHAGERELLAGKLKTGGSDVDENKIKADIAAIDHKYKACAEQATALTALHYRKSVVEFSAQGPGSLGISGDEWDLKPWLLPCRNGVVDLRTGDLHHGRQEDYLKTFCPTDYQQQGTIRPTWERTLMDILQHDQAPDRDLYFFVQRLFGCALIGEVIEHILPIFYGIGRNGKDTILSAIHHVLGDLAGPIQAEMLLDNGRMRSSAGPSPDIMALRGRRIAWAAETNEGRKMDTARVKYLTGGTWLTGRPPFGKRDISFPPSHTLFLMTNHKPRVNADDYAAWKRLLLIPFQNSFVDDPNEPHEKPKDTDLPNKLKAEASGILAWLVEGCLDWQKYGLSTPDIVKNATLEYQAAEDIINLFVGDCCDQGANYWTPAEDLYREYRQWCDDAGIKPMTGTAFGTRIGKRFTGERRKENDRKRARGYLGIRIISECDEMGG